MFLTFADCVEHGLDYLGGTADLQAERDCRRSVLQAYRDLMNARTWSYLYSHGRVITNAPYSTGFVAYNQTGGQYEREVILYQGTWPTWAGPGTELRIGAVTHMVAERKSDSIITLDTQVNPGSDLDYNPVPMTGISRTAPITITSVAHGLKTGATVIVEGAKPFAPGGVISANGTWTVTVPMINGLPLANTFTLNGSDGTGDGSWDGVSGIWRLPPTTPFTLYQDTYLLPPDFIKSDTAIYEGNFGGLSYSDPTDELWWQRFTKSAGTPRFYTLRGSRLFPGRMVIGFFPYPDQVRTIDYICERRPRDLRIPSYSAGTLTVVPLNPTILTGNGTAFDATMTGSVIRIGTATQAPTSWVGVFPPLWEDVIVEVLSPTMLRVADAVPVGATMAKYVISDPIDIELASMENAMFRGIEKNLSIGRSTQGKPDAFAAYDQALKMAQAADSRSFQGRSMGGARSRTVAWKYMPANFFPGT